jgi:mRNA interferase MazF
MSQAAHIRFVRGDIVWINCDPSVGAEPRKVRTCVVVSNDVANQYGQTVTVIPTQSYSAARAERAYMVDLRTPRSDLNQGRVANASMVMTYDRLRVSSLAGRVTAETLQRIDSALGIHLALMAS